MSETEDVGCGQALKHLVEFVDQELQGPTDWQAGDWHQNMQA